MPTPISLVLFDMDDVLSHYDRAARVECLAECTGRTPAAVRRAIWESGLESRADAGTIGDGSYLMELGELLSSPVSRADWLIARRASMSPNVDVLALAQAVSARCRIAVLTNNCRMVAEHIRYLSPAVAELFGDRIYASATFGAAKPAEEVFLRCLDALDAKPGETLFVDDLEENVKGAIGAGLKGHHFTCAETLAIELRRVGLL
jgi:HAD superfamily hydrolase (TIGR01509 family)